MTEYKIKVPEADNKFVSALRAKLSLTSLPFLLDTVPGANDEVRACFINVEKRVKSEGGETVFGWQFWEHPYMIQAEFHAVWRKPDGSLVDITPKDDDHIRRILFVEDPVRKFDGTQTDNLRINTTDNELIDDLIEVEKAKYRFMNTDGREKVIGVVHLENEDARLWESLIKLSAILGGMHLAGGNIISPCFCRSGHSYVNCHRESVQKGMLEI